MSSRASRSARARTACVCSRSPVASAWATRAICAEGREPASGLFPPGTPCRTSALCFWPHDECDAHDGNDRADDLPARAVRHERSVDDTDALQEPDAAHYQEQQPDASTAGLHGGIMS